MCIETRGSGDSRARGKHAIAITTDKGRVAPRGCGGTNFKELKRAQARLLKSKRPRCFCFFGGARYRYQDRVWRRGRKRNKEFEKGIWRGDRWD